MCVAVVEEVGEFALCEESVGGEGFAGEVEFEGFEHGDDGADFVGAFGVVGGVEGDAGDFFWVCVVRL